MSPTSKQSKFNTLTTAGRIAKAAHDRERAAAKSSPSSPPPDSMPPKKKSRRIPVLAPPAELEAEAAGRVEAKKKPQPKSKKTPLTTKDKIAASKKKKPFIPVEQDDDEKGFRAGRSREAKAKGEKPRNLMDIMRDLGQMGSAAPISAGSTVAGKVQTVASSGPKGRAKGKTREKESVLVRPTERTRRMQLQQSRQRLDEALAVSSINIKREEDAGPSSNHGASLMGLALELQQRIWRLVVVETQFFVYPAINQEQPDLAMTSRKIRNDVLPLYYGENTFAIEIPASVEVGMGKKKSKDPERTSLLLMRKWMAALEGREYFGAIRKWALSWAPPLKDLRSGGPEHAENREVMVSICYPKPGSGNEQATWPEIEIHRQAFCLLKSHEQFRLCVCMCYPSWLDNAVAAAVLAEGQDRGKQIVMIARDVENRGGELVGSRCEDDVVELE